MYVQILLVIIIIRVREFLLYLLNLALLMSVLQGSLQGGSQHELSVDWCGKMWKDRKVFLSVLGLNSQP